MYQSADFGGAKQSFENGQELTIPDKNEITAGVRPVYHMTDTFGLAFEYGITSVKNAFADSDDNGDNTYKDATLQKWTLAPLFGLGRSYWEYGKPQLRLFYTLAQWSDSLRGSTGGEVYKNHTVGWSAGAQVELWW